MVETNRGRIPNEETITEVVVVFAEVIDELACELGGQLRAVKADLPTTAVIGEYVADFRENLTEGSIPKRKALIRCFVESIEVDD